jgi:anti-anti-sigma regulatory factor
MLSKLILLNRSAESAGVPLALCNLSSEILKILEFTRLTQILTVYPSEKEALEHS